MTRITVGLVSVVLILGLVGTAGAFSGSGSGTVSDPYIITNLDELQEMQLGLSAWYELGNDIDAYDTVNRNAGAGFDPVGDSSHGFTGHLNGNNFTISGLYIYRGSADYVGLFAKIDKGSVDNLALTDFNITGSGYVGGLVGHNYYGSIENCHSQGGVTGTSQVGGLVGYATYGDITNCDSAGSVTGSSNYVGGLVGYAYSGTIANCGSAGGVTGTSQVGGLVGYAQSGTITNCGSAGGVTGTSQVGGLVGYAQSATITKCGSAGSVTGSSNSVGGLVGYAYSGTIANCKSTGTVTGTAFVGGSVGGNYSSISNSYSTGTVFGTDKVGGFVGSHDSSSIQGCFSTSDVTGVGMQCGGFVGYSSSSITDCFAAIGDVIGYDYVGGFAGEITSTTTNCYSAGTVTAPSNAGGFAGWSSGTCNNCFWDTDTSGQILSACGTGKTTAEMMQKATFYPSWDFSTVWGINEGQTYPYLMKLWPTCGDPWHPYPIGDLNHDCHVDFQDFAVMASHWLESTPGI